MSARCLALLLCLSALAGVASPCEDPPEIRHGRAKGRKSGPHAYLPGDWVVIVCERGTVYQRDDDFVACKAGTGWDAPFVHCAEVNCARPVAPENGRIVDLDDATLFPNDFSVTYVCDPGFRLVGPSWDFCNSEGLWNEDVPRCEVTRCPDPGVPEHGARSGDAPFGVGDRVQFRCFEGFERVGSEERWCMSNGQWNGQLTRCNSPGNFCEDPGVPIGGWKNGSTYSEGDRVGFGCLGNLSRIGSAVRECLPDRTWSGEEARCLGERALVEISVREMRIELAHGRHSLAAEHDFDLGASVAAILGRAVSELQRAGPERLVLYFVFDMAYGLGMDNLRHFANFAKAVVEKVGISAEGARAGALTFSSILFLPAQYDNTSDVLRALDNIEYPEDQDLMEAALRRLREEVMPLTREQFGGKRLKSVLFILTDVIWLSDPEDEPRRLKEAGVEVYCLEVAGDFTNRDRLRRVASDPKDEHAFVLDNFATLDWLAQQITNDNT